MLPVKSSGKPNNSGYKIKENGNHSCRENTYVYNTYIFAFFFIVADEGLLSQCPMLVIVI